MLTQIRERSSGWIAWVIVVLITIPFALWGIQSYFEGAEDVTIAVVNGEEINLYAYQDRLSQERQNALQQAGQNFDSSFLNSTLFRERVAETMVSGLLATQYVREHNYRPSDALLQQRIRNAPSFQQDGEFDRELYRDVLRANGFTPQQFEALERQNTAVAQFQAGVTETAFVTEYEMERLLGLQAQTREADFVLLSGERFDAEITIPAEEVEQYYQDNLVGFETEARVRVQYIELGVEDLAAGITPTEAEIREVYEQSGGRYAQAEVRKASHILFAVDAEADEAARDAAREKAEAVLVEAQGGGGADFAELAKEHSDDPGSKGLGGDLGVVTRGQMVAPFEEAVFDMEADEIRGPIETQFGYHLIRLTELTTARQQPLAEVREQISEEIRRSQAEALFAERSEIFENLVFEDATDLGGAAEALGLEIQESDWFTAQEGEGVAEEAQVRAAAFTGEVLEEELNSATVEIGFERVVALRKLEYEPSRVQGLEEVRAGIEEDLKAREAEQRVARLGASSAAELNAGQRRWEAFLAEEKLVAKALPKTRADALTAAANSEEELGVGAGELAVLMNSVFSQPHPVGGVSFYNGVSLGNGDFALYALKKVTAGSSADVDESQRASLRQQLLARDGTQMFQQLMQSVLEQSDVFIDREQLQESAVAF